jgi:hypothetical protein
MENLKYKIYNFEFPNFLFEICDVLLHCTSFLFDPMNHLHLPSSKNKVRHQKVEEMMFGSPEKTLQYGSRGTNIFLRPEVSLLEFSDGHLLWLEDHMAHIIMRPIVIENPIFFLQPLSKGSSWERS